MWVCNPCRKEKEIDIKTTGWRLGKCDVCQIEEKACYDC